MTLQYSLYRLRKKHRKVMPATAQDVNDSAWGDREACECADNKRESEFWNGRGRD